MANQQAPRDVNRVTTLLGVDDVTGETRPLLVDSATGRLLISATGGGGGTPGGLDTQVQYNNAGAFGGTDLLYSNATGNYALGTTLSTTDSWKFVKTLTPASGTTVGQRIESYSNASAGGTVHVGQLLQGGSTPGNAQDFNQLGGSQSASVHAGTGTVLENIGSISDTLISSSGNVAWGYAGIFRVRGTSTGIYTSGAIGAWILSPQLSGGSTVQDLYGLYIDPQTSGLGENYAIYYNNTTDGFYVRGNGKTGLGVVSPAYRLDVAGDVRITSTTNQQWLYVNNSPIEGLKAHRIEISSADGTINYTGVQSALTSGVAKSSGSTIGFEASLVVNAGDSGGSYIGFSAGNITASGSTQTAFSVGTGWDQAMSISEGPIRWTGGKAVVASDYSITRDADATNQMHINVPTGATVEVSVNDVYTLGINNTGLRIAPSATSSGNPNIFTAILASNTGITASVEVPFYKIDLANTQTWATGNIGLQRFAEFTQPTIAFAGASSITQGIATLAIDGAPKAGTNATISAGSFGFLIGSPGVTVNASSNYNFGIIQAGLSSGTGAVSDHAGIIIGYGGSNVGMGDQTATTTRYAGVIISSATLRDNGSSTGTRTVTDAVGIDIEGAYSAGAFTTITNGPFALRVSGANSIKNIAGSVTRAIHVPDYTVTLANTTQVTSSGMSAIGIGQVTLAQSGGAVTVDNFASLYIKGAGVAGASVTVTNNYALWVDAGQVRFDEKVNIGDGTDSMTVNGSSVTTFLALHSENGLTESLIEMHKHSATAGAGALLYTARSRGTASSPTVVSSGDSLARFVATGYDGTDYATSSGIDFEVDGTPGSNDMPGRIVFNTSSDGSQTLTERMRISSTGNVEFKNATNSVTITQSGATSGTPLGFLFTSGAHTTLANSDLTQAKFNINSNVQFTGGGADLTYCGLQINNSNVVSASVAQNFAGAVGVNFTGLPNLGSNVTIDVNTQAYFGGFGSETLGSGTAGNYNILISQVGISNGIGAVTTVAGIGIADLGGQISLGNQTATLTNLNLIRLDALTFASNTNTRTVTNPATFYASAPIAGTNVTFTNQGLAGHFVGPTKLEGSVVHAYVAKTANYTLTNLDYTVNCTTNSFDITFPTAVGITGTVYVVKNSGSGKTITLKTTSAQTIDGNASGALTLAYLDRIMVQSDGANWIIIAT